MRSVVRAFSENHHINRTSFTAAVSALITATYMDRSIFVSFLQFGQLIHLYRRQDERSCYGRTSISDPSKIPESEKAGEKQQGTTEPKVY